MIITGVSKPFFAKYSEQNGEVSYSEGGILGRMKEVGLVVNTSGDGNDVYLDNALADSERTFSDGTLTLATDLLSQEVSAAILGVTPVPLGNIEGVTDVDVMEHIYDDNQKAPFLGVGLVIRGKERGVVRWKGLVVTKVKFDVPETAATTQEKQISWQVPTVTAAVMRDDSSTHRWQRHATFSTEDQAVAYIKNRLNITEAAE